MELFIQLLRDNSVRLTKPRKLIYEALNSASEPMTLPELIRACPDVDRVSIYRTLDKFQSLGIITVVPTGWKKRYELAEPLKPHHHHLQCTVCGAVEPIHSSEVESLIHAITEQHGYELNGHHFEVLGVCPGCHI